jgi:hypothetical protein
MRLEVLDKINNIDFSYLEKKIDIIYNNLGGSPIWEIKNFFTPFICKNIIEIINGDEHNNFTPLNFRDCSRLIFRDKNNILENLINKRLKKILPNLNEDKKWVKPYGFNRDIVWKKNDCNINGTFRINKYTNSEGTEYHRDAQFTEAKNIKSNYTVLIYLNDSYKSGETIFLKGTEKYQFNGMSIKEEIKKIGRKKETIKIIPEIGKCIIFDQRLLHKSNSIKGEKYVLRTELICQGQIIEDNENNLPEKIELENSIEILAKKLFRQAQYYDLENELTDLYDRVINLRQNPSKINKYPKNLEKLLVSKKYNLEITKNIILKNRSSNCYIYYFGCDLIDFSELIRFTSLFTILSLISQLTKNTRKTILKEIRMIYGTDSFNIFFEDDEREEENDENDENDENENDENDENENEENEEEEENEENEEEEREEENDENDENDEDDEDEREEENDDEDEDEDEREEENDDEDEDEKCIGSKNPEDHNCEDINIHLNSLMSRKIIPKYDKYERQFKDDCKFKKPLSMKIKMKSVEIHETLHCRCGLRDSDDDCDEDIFNRKCFCGISDFKKNNENFIGNIVVEKKTEKNISGFFKINLIKKEFNHASCQCDRYESIGNEKELSCEFEYHVNFDIDIKYRIITIKAIPHIVL